MTKIVAFYERGFILRALGTSAIAISMSLSAVLPSTTLASHPTASVTGGERTRCARTLKWFAVVGVLAVGGYGASLVPEILRAHQGGQILREIDSDRKDPNKYIGSHAAMLALYHPNASLGEKALGLAFMRTRTDSTEEGKVRSRLKQVFSHPQWVAFFTAPPEYEALLAFALKNETDPKVRDFIEKLRALDDKQGNLSDQITWLLRKKFGEVEGVSLTHYQQLSDAHRVAALQRYIADNRRNVVGDARWAAIAFHAQYFSNERGSENLWPLLIAMPGYLEAVKSDPRFSSTGWEYEAAERLGAEANQRLPEIRRYLEIRRHDQDLYLRLFRHLTLRSCLDLMSTDPAVLDVVASQWRSDQWAIQAAVEKRITLAEHITDAEHAGKILQQLCRTIDRSQFSKSIAKRFKADLIDLAERSVAGPRRLFAESRYLETIKLFLHSGNLTLEDLEKFHAMVHRISLPVAQLSALEDLKSEILDSALLPGKIKNDPGFVALKGQVEKAIAALEVQMQKD